MDRNAPSAIYAGIFVSVVGVFALMIMPIVPGVLMAELGFSKEVAAGVISAEVGGGALASILAMFWIAKINWRAAALTSIVVVIVGNFISVYITDPSLLTMVRFLVGFLGQGTAFAIGISLIGSTSDPDKNFGFVIAAQVAFGVLALLTLQRFVNAFDSIGGIYLPLGVVALMGLFLIGKLPVGFDALPEQHAEQKSSSVFLPIVGLIVMLIWCSGLGAMWTFVGQIGVANGLEPVLAQQALAISSAVAIVGAFSAAALAGKGVNRLIPVIVALFIQMVMAWFLQGQMSWIELAIKASIFQIFWNMTGPFIMGAIASADTGGKVSVLIPAAQTAGFAIGPMIAVAFMTEGSLIAANYTTIIFCAVALLVFIPLAIRLKTAGH
ncbi:MAG: MFS transporter [Gammaproteobacteria bacterium]|nr:MFS transporter [Gammaproteobacteria bacterium]MCP4089518.1 MFS transporter [Gammaproteobacteria bacterium]MCP4832921.1 MFS transporter [Gammaproteobacteria bacterium]MCP4930046.1 MFS transporter [Gammaproteobacteria bacterium]